MIIGVNARLLLAGTLEGVARYVYESTIQMAIQHPGDQFILYLDRPLKSKFSFPDNVKFRLIPVPTRHPLLWITWFELLLPLFLWRDKVDVFYSGDGYVSLVTSVPQVLVTHDLAYIHYPGHLPFLTLWYNRIFIPRFHKKAKMIIAVSEATKADIMQQFGISDDQVQVAGNAVTIPDSTYEKNVSEFFQKTVMEKQPYFCFVGALHPRKNVTGLCASFATFKNKTGLPHHLLIAGRYAWKSGSIQKIIEETPCVHYIGQISEDEKIFLYKNAESLIYLSLFEGFGIPILEAMACGTPVITSNLSSMPEVAGDAAIKVDPNNPSEVAEAMLTMTNQGLKEKYKLEGFKKVKSYSWSKTADIIYFSLLSVKKG